MYDYFEFVKDRQLMCLGMALVLMIGFPLCIGLLVLRDKIVKLFKERKG